METIQALVTIDLKLFLTFYFIFRVGFYFLNKSDGGSLTEHISLTAVVTSFIATSYYGLSYLWSF